MTHDYTPIEFRPLALFGVMVKGIVWTFAALTIAGAGILVYVAATSNSAAQAYAGVRAVISSQIPAGLRPIPNYYRYDYNREVINLYAGYTRGDWSVEVGGGDLGRWHAHNVGADFNITQVVTTSYVYAGVLRHWTHGKFSAHAMLGAARVMFKNHEFGTNDAGPGQVQLNYGADRAPVYGIGAAYRITPTTSLRVDAFRIDKIARSYWTRPHSDVSALAFGLQRNF